MLFFGKLINTFHAIIHNGAQYLSTYGLTAFPGLLWMPALGPAPISTQATGLINIQTISSPWAAVNLTRGVDLFIAVPWGPLKFY